MARNSPLGHWYEKFSNILTAFGFTRTAFDYFLIFKKIGKGYVILLVYVEDIIITGSDTKGNAEIKIDLQSKLKVKDLGRLQYVRGIEVLRGDKGYSYVK